MSDAQVFADATQMAGDAEAMIATNVIDCFGGMVGIILTGIPMMRSAIRLIIGKRHAINVCSATA